MVYHFLLASLTIPFLMLIWFGVQQIIRKEAKIPDECDVLEDKIGCHGCKSYDTCDLKQNVN